MEIFIAYGKKIMPAFKMISKRITHSISLLKMLTLEHWHRMLNSSRLN